MDPNKLKHKKHFDWSMIIINRRTIWLSFTIPLFLRLYLFFNIIPTLLLPHSTFLRFRPYLVRYSAFYLYYICIYLYVYLNFIFVILFDFCFVIFFLLMMMYIYNYIYRRRCVWRKCVWEGRMRASRQYHYRVCVWMRTRLATSSSSIRWISEVLALCHPQL